MLDVGHGVEGHADCRDDDEGDGDAGDDFSCHGSVWLLYEIPQADLVLHKFSAPEIFFDLKKISLFLLFIFRKIKTLSLSEDSCKF